MILIDEIKMVCYNKKAGGGAVASPPSPLLSLFRKDKETHHILTFIKSTILNVRKGVGTNFSYLPELSTACPMGI